MRAEKYARTPWAVLGDSRLDCHDKCVYAAVAGHVFHGTTARVGRRQIQALLHISPRRIAAALKRLEECGHLTVVEPAHGKRSYFNLSSTVFGNALRTGRSVIVASRSGVPREVGAPQRRRA